MKLNRKRIGIVVGVLALVGLFAFSGVALAQQAQPNAQNNAPGGPWGMLRNWGHNMMRDGFGRGMMGGGFGPEMMKGWGGPQSNLIDIAAKVLGKDRTALLTDLQSGKSLAEIAGDKTDEIVTQALDAHKTNLDAMVKAGRLTQAQADAQLSLMKANLAEGVKQTFQGRGFGPNNGILSVAADVLGKDVATLTKDLQGKTLAEVAGDKTDAIISKMVENRKTQLDAMVKAGRLTQAQADAMLNLEKVNLAEMVKQPFQAPGFGRGMGKGFGGMDGDEGRGWGMGSMGRGGHMGGRGDD